MVNMKISAISDVHVKSPGDEADRLLCRFLDHPEVQNSQYVALLGDIFDLMCGPHEAYIQRYQHIFTRLAALQEKGCRIIYVEGNHDVHLEKLFKKVWKHNEIVPVQHPIIESIEGKTYYFSHGDEHEIHNEAYQRYIKLIRSTPLKIVADYLIPYSVLHFLGERASAKSRKKGARTFDEKLVKETFRQGVETTTEGKYDFVLGGHSHVQDDYQFGSSVYLNNGYALHTKTFIHISDHQHSFIPLL